MTDPADFTADDEQLPGLAPPQPREAALVRSIRRTIRALDGVGLIDEQHAGLCQLMLDLAEVVDAGRRNGKASAAAMAAAQILAIYQQLVPDATAGGEDDEWSNLVAEFRRSATAPRDST